MGRCATVWFFVLVRWMYVIKIRLFRGEHGIAGLFFVSGERFPGSVPSGLISVGADKMLRKDYIVY